MHRPPNNTYKCILDICMIVLLKKITVVYSALPGMLLSIQCAGDVCIVSIGMYTDSYDYPFESYYGDRA